MTDPIVRAVGPYTSFVPEGGREYGLGRHIHHDPMSRQFAFEARAATLAAIRHFRQVEIFDQGNLGSCVGNAALGILGTEPYFSAIKTAGMMLGDGVRIDDGKGHQDLSIPFTEDGAVWLYSDITQHDPFPGYYKPGDKDSQDTGSDGLSAAKVLKALGVVPAYKHTFSLNTALAALQEYPLMVGTNWTADMFKPDQFGIIQPFGQVVGGHEWIVDQYLPAGAPFRSRSGTTQAPMIGGTTSWGTSFGDGGRFYMSTAAFGTLLKQSGDVIVLTPPAILPAPVPAPTTSADEVARKVRETLVSLGL